MQTHGDKSVTPLRLVAVTTSYIFKKMPTLQQYAQTVSRRAEIHTPLLRSQYIIIIIIIIIYSFNNS